MPVLAATVGPSTITAASVCEVVDRKQYYLGKRVDVVGQLVNAEPHGIYLRDPRKDHLCLLHVGDMASGKNDDVWTAFLDHRGTPKLTAAVRISGVLKTGMWNSEFGGRQYRSYFLDQMTITVLR